MEDRPMTTLAVLPTAPYQPVAVYFAESDCVEYVKEDTFCVYDRVDNFLTLIYDGTRAQLIGFKLKGFKSVFDTHLKSLYKLNDEQFVYLVSAIEAVCTTLGDKLFTDTRVEMAYKAARQLAANDDVQLFAEYAESARNAA
jgi:hypothetical protein